MNLYGRGGAGGGDDSEYGRRYRLLDRRRALAEALLGQGMNSQQEPMQMIPGPYGPVAAGGNPIAQGIKTAGSLLGAGLMSRGLDEEERQIGADQQKGQSEWLAGLMSGNKRERVEGSAMPNAPDVYLSQGGAMGSPAAFPGPWGGGGELAGPRMPVDVERPLTQEERIAHLLQGQNLGGAARQISSAQLQQMMLPKKYVTIDRGGVLTRVAEDQPGEWEKTPSPAERSADWRHLTPSGSTEAQIKAARENIGLTAAEARRTKQTPGAPSVSVSYSDPESLRLRREELELSKKRLGAGAEIVPEGGGKISGITVDRQGNKKLAPDVVKVVTKGSDDARLAADALDALEDLEGTVKSPAMPESGMGAAAAAAGSWLPSEFQPKSSAAMKSMEAARANLLAVLNDPRMKGNPSEYEGRKVLEAISDPAAPLSVKLEAITRFRETAKRTLENFNAGLDQFNPETSERLGAVGIKPVDRRKRGGTAAAGKIKAPPANPDAELFKKYGIE